MNLRLAAWQDRGHFLRLWRQFMEEEAMYGSRVEPTDGNLLEYLRLFDSYVRGSLFGFCLLAQGDQDPEPVACLLGGETPPGGLSLTLSHGKAATLWGVYVEPEHRRKGLAGRLQDRAKVEAREMGFKVTVSGVLASNEAGEVNAKHWQGGIEVLGWTLVASLEE
jgi:GNAT superfamily N-acetyltransferase